MATTNTGPDDQAPSHDDGHRYALTGPRGVSEAITVHGSQDLARRVNQANRLGVCVAWRQLDQQTTDDTDGW